MHGGASLVGMAGPSFTTGRRSKYLPPRLLASYQAAIADPELLNLRDELALTDARLNDLLERADTGESGETWRTLASEWGAYQDALSKGNDSEAGEHAGQIAFCIFHGRSDAAIWSEIQGVIEQRRRLAESEQKRLVNMQAMVTSEQVMTLVAALAHSVNTHVTDRKAKAAISADLARLLTRP